VGIYKQDISQLFIAIESAGFFVFEHAGMETYNAESSMG
jgi:hypothetical protein